MIETTVGDAVIQVDVTDYNLLGKAKKPKKIYGRVEAEDGSLHISHKANGLSGIYGGGLNPEVVVRTNERGNLVVSVTSIFGEMDEPREIDGVERKSIRASSSSRDVDIVLKGFVVR